MFRALTIFFFASLVFPCAVSAEELVPETIMIPAGEFITGSDKAEREAAYQLDEKAYGHSVTRKNRWYDFEDKRRTISLPAFKISRTLITNAQYKAFIDATGHKPPKVHPRVWAGYKLIHPYKRTIRHTWRKGAYPKGRARHPVVMVSYDDALAYAKWLSTKSGSKWRR